jgi:hypothetical protein
VLDADRVELVLDPILPDHIHVLILRKLEDVFEVGGGREGGTEDFVLFVDLSRT